MGTSNSDAETILFVVKDGVARAGLPPNDIQDDFHARSTIVGQLNEISKLAFHPAGELFAVRGEELYRGPMPLDANLDWFSAVKRVGKSDWDKVKDLLFAPCGLLYTVTKEGELYKGSAPSNDDVSWLYDEATKVGTTGWNRFNVLFFDRKGVLYAVTDEDKLVMRNPPTKAYDNWFSSSTVTGNGEWQKLTHFMDVGPDGDLWCVASRNGNFYKGPIPNMRDIDYLEKAEKLGCGYNIYPLMSITLDKTMQSILSCEFLPYSGKILYQSTKVVHTMTYSNASFTPLKCIFSFSKTLTQTSTFSQDHGFTVAAGMTFKAGVPFIAVTEAKISIDLNTTHTWSFTKENETQKTFSSSTDVEVPAGHAVCMIASVTKGEMDVPYRVVIRTFFGHQSTIYGTWRGVTHYNLMVTHDDYKPEDLY